MTAIPNTNPTPLLAFTRWTIAVTGIMTLLTALNLYLFPGETANQFAWTIKNPLTAAFLGAGYLAAVPGLAWYLRTGRWGYARISIVVMLTFSLVTLQATFRHLDEFHFNQGSTIARLNAWFWIVVYIALPLCQFISFVLQERAGGRSRYAITRPLAPWLRVALLTVGTLLAVYGLGLAAGFTSFAKIWPWTLPPLAAGAVGGWMVALATSYLWAVREGDWQRVRISMIPWLAYFIWVPIAAARFSDRFGPDLARTWLFLLVVAGLFMIQSFAVWQHERRFRSAVATQSGALRSGPRVGMAK